MRHLHADRSREPVAHRSQATRGHPAIGIFKAKVLCSPHLVLANLGADVAILAVLRQLFKARQRVLWFDDRAFLLELQAVNLAPFFDLAPPFRDRRAVRFASARFPDAQHVFKHVGHIADDRHINMDHLVDGRWIDIDMRLFRLGREILHSTRDPVVKARTDVDHQIAAMHGEVGLIKPVHSQHAQPVFAGRRITAQSHKGGRDRKTRRVDKFAQQLCGRIA